MKKLWSIMAFLWILSPHHLWAGEEDPLHKREFTASLSETRNGIVQKRVIQDFVRFKNGRIQSDFIKKKFGFKYIRYRINQDTSYVDSTGANVRKIKFEASATDENNITVQMVLTSLEWDLDGYIRITRNDRLKKYYDLSGREKGGRPPKQKKQEQKKELAL